MTQRIGFLAITIGILLTVACTKNGDVPGPSPSPPVTTTNTTNPGSGEVAAQPAKLTRGGFEQGCRAGS